MSTSAAMPWCLPGPHLRDPAARRALRAFIDYAFTARWRTTSTRSPSGEVQPAKPSSRTSTLGATDADRAAQPWSRTWATSTRARVNSSPWRGHHPAGRQVRSLRGARRRGRERRRGGPQRPNVPDDVAARRADPGERQEMFERAGHGEVDSVSIRRPATRSSPRTAASAPTSPRSCPDLAEEQSGAHGSEAVGIPEGGQTEENPRGPRTGSLLKIAGALDHHPRGRACKLLSLPRMVGEDAEGGRSPRRTAGTDPT